MNNFIFVASDEDNNEGGTVMAMRTKIKEKLPWASNMVYCRCRILILSHNFSLQSTASNETRV
jgi:hypothetical protein